MQIVAGIGSDAGEVYELYVSDPALVPPSFRTAGELGEAPRLLDRFFEERQRKQANMRARRIATPRDAASFVIEEVREQGDVL